MLARTIARRVRQLEEEQAVLAQTAVADERLRVARAVNRALGRAVTAADSDRPASPIAP